MYDANQGPIESLVHLVYQGAGHAFHNDTSPAYNSAAACDAWNRTLAWFNKFLRPPAA